MPDPKTNAIIESLTALTPLNRAAALLAVCTHFGYFEEARGFLEEAENAFAREKADKKKGLAAAVVKAGGMCELVNANDEDLVCFRDEGHEGEHAAMTSKDEAYLVIRWGQIR